MRVDHHYQDLIEIFQQTFYSQYQTRLVKGEGEPVYLPGDQADPDHRIVFAYGYFASALHEISHWLVAGAKRRQLEDFGYWYNPDGRTAQQQAVFESVEVKPQAIEWLLCVAAGFNFNVSCDNLNGEPTDRLTFQHNVHQQVLRYIEQGFSKRLGLLIAALADFYQTSFPLTVEQFAFDSVTPITTLIPPEPLTTPLMSRSLTS